MTYTLLRRLGKGGMAEVWYAENDIEKPASVKILNADLAMNENVVERFRNEARIMVKLNHANIRQVYDYASLDNRPCIVMEYLEGEDLSARMKRGERFSDSQLRQWWNQLASALNYTHAQGVVHRDIKPSNIFIDREGNVKLLDFGIAKVRDSITSTATGATMGTLMYMSPEQADDAKHVDGRSDIYSLAVSFVSLIQGHTPYNEQTESQRAILNHIAEHPLDMTGVPVEWQNFLRPYLAKNPKERPALRAFDAGEETRLVPPVISDSVSEETVAESSAAVSILKEEETMVDGATEATSVQADEKTVAEFPYTQPQPQSQPLPRKRKAWPWFLLVLVAVLVSIILQPRGCGNKSKVPRHEVNSAETEIITPAVDMADQMVDEMEQNVAPEGYVDLGLSVYWKEKNEWNPSDDHGFYTYDDAKKKFGKSLPTKAQLEELVDKCTWTWSDSKKGYDVKGPNGNSIFLPAAGERACIDDRVYNVGNGGNYWSSTPSDSEHVWYLYFGPARYYVYFRGSHCLGYSVRLVQGK